MNIRTFRARGLLSCALLSTFLWQISGANASVSVQHKATHNIHISGSEYGKPLNVTWTPKPEFSNNHFSSFISRHQNPDGVWTTHYGSSLSVTPNKQGNWCFKVRGYSNGNYGNYSPTSCITIALPSVAGQITHDVSAPTSGQKDQNLTVSWSTKPAYSHLNFGAFNLAIKNPLGQWTWLYNTFFRHVWIHNFPVIISDSEAMAGISSRRNNTLNNRHDNASRTQDAAMPGLYLSSGRIEPAPLFPLV